MCIDEGTPAIRVRKQPITRGPLNFFIQLLLVFLRPTRLLKLA